MPAYNTQNILHRSFAFFTLSLSHFHAFTLSHFLTSLCKFTQTTNVHSATKLRWDLNWNMPRQCGTTLSNATPPNSKL